MCMSTYVCMPASKHTHTVREREREKAHIHIIQITYTRTHTENTHKDNSFQGKYFQKPFIFFITEYKHNEYLFATKRSADHSFNI